SSTTSLTQRDRLTGQPYSSQVGQPYDLVSGSVLLTTPPQPIDTNQSPAAIDTRFDPNLNTLFPYNVLNHSTLLPTDKTGDIVHRYWHEQSQINHGKMNWFVTWSDNPGLVMSYFDATNLPEGKLAQKYTLCDNFFHAAFGGSFLNHQWLISASTPTWPAAPADLLVRVDANGVMTKDGTVTPDGFVVNTAYTVTTPHPSGMKSDHLVPLQTQPTIGDRLSEKGISWAW